MNKSENKQNETDTDPKDDAEELSCKRKKESNDVSPEVSRL